MPKKIEGMPKGIRRRGNKFQWDCSFQGKRRTGTADTIEQAVKDREKAYIALLKGDTTTTSYTLKDAIEQAFMEKWNNSASIETAEKRVKFIIEFFGEECNVNTIDEERIGKFKAWLRSQGNSPATINRKTSALSVILRQAYTMRKLQRLPLIGRLKEDNTNERYVTEREERRMIEVLLQWGKMEHAYAIVILVDTGMRCGELLTVRKNDVDFDKKRLSVWKQNTKTKRSRTIPLTSRALAAFEKMIGLRADTLEENPVLFPYDHFWIRYMFDKVKAEIGLADEEAFTPHTLRHTYCSRLAQAGVPIQRIAALAGHTAIKTTMRYAHLIPDDFSGITEILEKTKSIPAIDERLFGVMNTEV